MNSGIRDAHNLAWKLAAIVRGQLGPGLLETYENERRPHVWEMIRLALWMGRVMAPRGRPEAWAVEHALRLLRLSPPARDYIAEMRWRPVPRFSFGFLLPERGGPAPQTPVGRLLPQPWVETADGRTVRLDEALGNRFVLLAQTARSGRALAAAAHPVWDRLDVRRVLVRPGAGGGEVPPGLEVVWDGAGAVGAAFARRAGHILLLRPDHYVAACIPPGALDRAAQSVGALAARTWERPAS